MFIGKQKKLFFSLSFGSLLLFFHRIHFIHLIHSVLHIIHQGKQFFLVESNASLIFPDSTKSNPLNIVFLVTHLVTQIPHFSIKEPKCLEGKLFCFLYSVPFYIVSAPLHLNTIVGFVTQFSGFGGILSYPVWQTSKRRVLCLSWKSKMKTKGDFHSLLRDYQ